MEKKCLKCGYERQPTDTAPDYGCPSCGAVYAKMEALYGLAQGQDNHSSTKSCPYCGENILAVAKKCKHCQSDLTQPASSVIATKAPYADYGIFLLALPVVSTLLIWFWVGNMNLLQDPVQTLSIIGFSTVFITALIAAMEAAKVGMVSNKQQGTYSPIAWFFVILLLWIIGYPAYLYKRRKYGLTNFLAIGVIVALFFIGSQLIMGISIEQQKAKVRDILGLPHSSQDSIELQRQNIEAPLVFSEEKNKKRARIQIEDLSAALDIYRLENGRYPSTQEGIQALVENVGNVKKWNGPYLKSGKVPLDPWGNNYHYRSPGQNGSFDLWSYGADNKEGGGNDILGWQ